MTTTKKLNRKVLVVEFNTTRGEENFKEEAEKIRSIDREIERKWKKIHRNQQIIKFRAKTVKAHTICSGVAGFILGFAMAIAQTLAVHGPTVTIWGTALATIAYLASGALFAFVFSYLGRQGSADIIQFLRESSDSCKEEIAELESEKREHLGRAAFAAANAAFCDED